MEENRIIDAMPEMQVSGGDAEGEILSLEDSIGEDPEDTDAIGDYEGADGSQEEKIRSEREEYDFLIKNRFKALYAEDTQRLINRRFRKYKVMEERYKALEEALAQKEAEIGENMRKIADFDGLLRSEVEKAIKETEERVISEIRAKQLRPAENGAMPRVAPSPFNVSRLSRDDRARLAKRAAGGEKIKF